MVTILIEKSQMMISMKNSTSPLKLYSVKLISQCTNLKQFTPFMTSQTSLLFHVSYQKRLIWLHYQWCMVFLFVIYLNSIITVMIWRPNKKFPLHYCPFCKEDMGKICKCSTLILYEFDNHNENKEPCKDRDDFLHHIKCFSMGPNNTMKCRYYCWLYIICNSIQDITNAD